MKSKSHRVCPIVGCQETIPGHHLMCQKHFKMIPRETQCEFFGEKAKVDNGDCSDRLREIGLQAVEEVAIISASRRANSRKAISKLKGIFA